MLLVLNNAIPHGSSFTFAIVLEHNSKDARRPYGSWNYTDNLRYLQVRNNESTQSVYIGKDGISDALLNSLGEAFNNRELVKVRIEKSCELERKEVGRQLAQAAAAHMVQVLGKTLLLYRPDLDKPEIKLP